jgi:hypothetical protein
LASGLSPGHPDDKNPKGHGSNRAELDAPGAESRNFFNGSPRSVRQGSPQQALEHEGYAKPGEKIIHH